MKDSGMQMELITTGIFIDENRLNKSVFAGDWCFCDKPGFIEMWQPLILAYPAKPQDVAFFEEKIKETFEILLSRITICYNEYFGLQKSDLYYKLILGRWLYHFLNNIYEKRLILKNALESYPGIFTKSCGIDVAESFDSDDYNQKTYLSHEFNFRLFSAIAELVEDMQTEKVGKDNNFYPTREQPITINNGWREKLIDIYQNVSCFLNSLLCTKMILVVSPYYPRDSIYNSLWFFLKSKGKIVHYKMRRVTATVGLINEELRAALSKKIEINSGNEFLDISSQLVFSFIPTSFLEKFSALRNESLDWHKKNKNCTVFFTANAIHTDERFKYLVAEKENAELWISQHGFGYGTNKVISSEVYERGISSRYFTWGWGKDVLQNPKLSAYKSVDYNKFSRIVFTFPSITDYSGLLETPLVYSYDIGRFIENSDKLVNHLHPEISGQINLRQQKKRGLRVLSLMKAVNEDHYPTFHESLLHARIHLTNHLGTPFLESIAMNIPTVVIHSPLTDYLRPEAIEDFNMLMSANILFTDPEIAARHLNQVYKNVDDWWLSDSTQKICKQFAYKYARSSDNWKKCWLETFLN